MTLGPVNQPQPADNCSSAQPAGTTTHAHQNYEDLSLEGCRETVRREQAMRAGRSPRKHPVRGRPTGKPWRRAAKPPCRSTTREQDLKQSAQEIQERHQTGPLLARILAGRGFKAGTELDRFLHPSLQRDLPAKWSLKNLAPACELILEAVRAGKRIAICCDYDVDGAASAAQLAVLFKTLGADFAIVASDRYRGGYGLKTSMVDQALQKKCGVIVAVDIGTTNHQALRYAADCGIQTVVVDHHKVLPAQGNPPAHIFINPSQKGCGFAQETLCSAGLTWFLACAVKEKLGMSSARGERAAAAAINTDFLLQFAALGTVADQVPLCGANRVIVKNGLRLMNDESSLALDALKNISGVKHKITSAAIAFQMAPRLNAVGRLAKESETPGVLLAIQELLSSDRKEAEELAIKLHEYNSLRKEIEKETLNACDEQIRQMSSLPAALVLWGADFHPGVLGIVASRIVDKHHRPAVLLAGPDKAGILKGSARSVPGLNITKAFTRLSRLLEGYGGHEGAAGLSVRQENLQSFADALAQEVHKTLRSKKRGFTVKAEIEMTADEILRAGAKFIEDLDKLEPTGRGNPALRVLLRDMRVFAVRTLGARHLKVTLRHKDGGPFIEGRMWHAPSHPALEVGNIVDIAARPAIDVRSRYNDDRRKLYLEIKAAQKVFMPPCSQRNKGV